MVLLLNQLTPLILILTIFHLTNVLASGSLLSIVQLCNFGYHVIFHKNAVQTIYNNNVILTSTRSIASNGLWIVNVNRPSFNEIPSCNVLAPVHTDQRCSDVFATEKYFCNVLTTHNNSIQERGIFLQATMEYPTKSTLRIAVRKRNLSFFPGGPVLLYTGTFSKGSPYSRKTRYTIYSVARS